MADAVTRTTVADGRVVGWYGDPSYVIDAEVTAAPVPPALAARFGTLDFWPRWTRAECAAKLADVPIVIWLHDHELTSGDAVVETFALGDLTVSVGRPPRVTRGYRR